MGWLDKAVIAVSNLGKGLVINPVTKLLDISISTDANNTIVYGSDNGVMVPDTIAPHVNAVDPHPQYQPRTEPTNGFVDRAQTTISFNESNRTFSISPTSTSFDVFSNGVKYTKTALDTLVCSDAEGLHVLYYNDSGTLSESTVFSTNHIMRWAIIALYYWNAADQKMVPGLQDERHGCQWASSQHLLDHLAIGAEYESGLDISLTADGNGSSIDHVRYTATSGYFQDEDLQHAVLPHALADNINYMYRSGANSWKSISTPNIVTTVGSGRAAYNYFNGTSWSLSEVSNGDYVISHLFVYPSVNGISWVCVPGTEIYTTRLAASLACQQHPNLGSLPAPEYKLIASVLIQTSNTYTNAAKSRIVAQDDGGLFVDWRHTSGSAGSVVTGGVVTSVNGHVGNVVLTSADVGAQSVLVSGANIKTINGQSILGGGNIVVSGDGTVVPQGATTHEVDFGTVPVYDKTFIVSVPGASVSDIINVFEVPSDDPDMDTVTYTGLVTAVGEVTIYAQAIPGPVKGLRLLAINMIAKVYTPMQSFIDDALLQDIIMVD